MRALLILLFFSSWIPAVALASDEQKCQVKSAKSISTGSAVARKIKSVERPNAATLSAEIQQLKDLVHAQAQELETQRAALREQQERLREEQERVAALEKQFKAVNASAVAAASLPNLDETESPEAVATSSSIPSGGTQGISNGENQRHFGPFSFGGDLRLRLEPTSGGPADHSLQQTRGEFRLRFNADARLNDQISGGFSLASGDLNNPISTNQTASQFYTRKPFELDRAFFNYHPAFFKALTLVGGKFSYPWYNTELTWDKDISPEGIAEALTFPVSSRTLKKIALVGFALPFAQTAGISLANKSIVGSAVYGGQAETSWRITGWLKLGAYSGFYDWHGADAVALAVATAESASPAGGLLPLNSNRAQNSMTTTTSTGIITDGVSVFPTGVKKVTGAQFASKFGLFDNIVRFDVKTSHERWPIALIGDFVQNTKACANVGNISLPPANTPTQIYSQSTNAPCDPRERRGYWLEARYGRGREKGDWQFSYTRILIEREAVLGVFNYSEIRQGSNVEEHRVEASYLVFRNVQLSFTGLFGRPLVTASSPGPAQNLLKRFQFDALYRF